MIMDNNNVKYLIMKINNGLLYANFNSYIIAFSPHFYPCIKRTNFWATIEFIHFLSFLAAHICKAPKISIFSCLAWNSLRVPSFFILVTVCIMSWISSFVQVSQKDMLFLHDSLSGPSGSEC